MINRILLTTLIALLLFSCGTQESPVDFAEVSVEFSYESSPSEETDTISLVTVTITCQATNHPDYNGNIEDFNDNSSWDISLSKTSLFPEITGEDENFETKTGTSAVFTHKFEMVSDDEVILDVIGKLEVQFASNLKKIYPIDESDNFTIP